jgi:hypothetical protein
VFSPTSVARSQRSGFHSHGRPIPLEDRDGSLEKRGIETIVRVERAHVLAVRFAQRAIAGCREAFVRSLKHARLRPPVTGDQRPRRLVCRPVVDDDHFDVGMGLRERAADRLVEEFAEVAARDEHRHERRARSHVTDP